MLLAGSKEICLGLKVDVDEGMAFVFLPCI